MSPEKIQEYIKTRASVRSCYVTTDMNVTQIAKLHRISQTKASRMIDGKNEPKFYMEGEGMKKVLFFNSGSSAVFDEDGNQMPELQKPYILMFAHMLELRGIDPIEVEFTLPSGEKARVFNTPEGYNWKPV
jgi:hypothetical protein